MSHFKSRRKGRIHGQLPPYAAGLLANLARQLIELLSDGEADPERAALEDDPLEAMLTPDHPRDAPEDPALRRLLPDAHRDDPEAAAEFRRFTESALRRQKIDDARTVLEQIGDVEQVGGSDVEFELDADSTRAWMRCLTDLRLTLAERLGVTADDEDYWVSMADDDPRQGVYEIYSWLGYLLESLLDTAQH